MRKGRETRGKHVLFHAFLKLVSQVRFLPGVLGVATVCKRGAFSPVPDFPFWFAPGLISDKKLSGCRIAWLWLPAAAPCSTVAGSHCHDGGEIRGDAVY